MPVLDTIMVFAATPVPVRIKPGYSVPVTAVTVSVVPEIDPDIPVAGVEVE